MGSTAASILSPSCYTLPHTYIPNGISLRYALTAWFYKRAAPGPPPDSSSTPESQPLSSSRPEGGESTHLSSSLLLPSGLSERSMPLEVMVQPMGARVGADERPLLPASLSSDAHTSGTRHKEGGTIYVSLVSYRDPEARWTVWDLFKKVGGGEMDVGPNLTCSSPSCNTLEATILLQARRPDLIYVGIVWQVWKYG